MTGVAGSSNRRAQLRVATGGSEALAQAVASQGEQHALALSVFLPRVESPENPFGFVLIDDPVQALDQVRVDGLIEVLMEAAQTKQVIVFSHDDRLAETAFRMGYEPTVLRVERVVRSGEVTPTVSVRRRKDAVTERLSEAHSILKDKKVTITMKTRVVAMLCDSALEVASLRAAERRWDRDGRSGPLPGSRGEPSTLDRVSVALTGELDEHFTASASSYGPQWIGHVQLMNTLRSSRHEAVGGDPETLLEATKVLVRELDGL